MNAAKTLIKHLEKEGGISPTGVAAPPAPAAAATNGAPEPAGAATA